MKINSPEQIRATMNTVCQMLKAEGKEDTLKLISNCAYDCEETSYDNWNGGTYYYTLYLTTDVETFVKFRDDIKAIETDILEKIDIATKYFQDNNEHIYKITIIPKSVATIDWSRISGISTKQSLIEDVNYLKNTMISVSTGGARIQDSNEEYKQKYSLVNKCFEKLNLKNPNPFKDLWEWYGKWSSGSMPQYRDRRTFIGEMFSSILQIIEETVEPAMITLRVDLSEWERIERSVNEIKLKEGEGRAEEQYQIVGLLCRETIISLAQAVYVEEKHPILDDVKVSKTDAKRMLDAYIVVELAGGSNDILRKYARATLDLANG